MSIARDYFINQAKILNSRYEGSATPHKGDAGNNREDILAEWLKQHLPRAVSPEIGGQIIDSKGNISNQADIVLYNDDAPRFGGNPKSYFFAEGTVAAIQVKSILTSGMMSSAIDNLESIKNCILKPPSGITIGTPSESIMTGIFAYELGKKDFLSTQSVVDSLKKYEAKGKKSVNFVCINQTTYIVYNNGEWVHSESDALEKTPLPKGYIEVDTSQECIFRMILTLSSEAKKNIATAHDFQSYFLEI